MVSWRVMRRKGDGDEKACVGGTCVWGPLRVRAVFKDVIGQDISLRLFPHSGLNKRPPFNVPSSVAILPPHRRAFIRPMKYIEIPNLARLAQALTHEGPECSVHTRIEAYSCKNIKRDKKLFKSLESAYNEDVSHSPPVPSFIALDREAEITPFGPMDKHSSRKTLYLLIATLNVAFPDHEFSDVKPAHFHKEQNGASVLNALSTTLVAPHRAGIRAPRTYSSYPPTSVDFFPSSLPTSSSPVQPLPSPYAPPQIVSGTHPWLYRVLDDIIGLTECEVFSYVPDIDSDPHASDFSDDEDDIKSVG